MYYAKNPFLKVGLPFLTAIVFGTFFLVDLRKSRYESQRNTRLTDKEEEIMNESKQKRNIKTLEEELKEWEEKHRRKIEEARGEYEMKPVIQK